MTPRATPAIPAASVTSATRAELRASFARSGPVGPVHGEEGQAAFESFHFEAARTPKYVPTPIAASPRTPTPTPTGRRTDPWRAALLVAGAPGPGPAVALVAPVTEDAVGVVGASGGTSMVC